MTFGRISAAAVAAVLFAAPYAHAATVVQHYGIPVSPATSTAVPFDFDFNLLGFDTTKRTLTGVTPSVIQAASRRPWS